MDESDRTAKEWIRQWIEQQRVLLQHGHALQPGQASAEVRQQVFELGNKWLDLGQDYLTGLQQFAHGGTAEAASPAGAAAKAGEELFAAWQNQWQSLAKALPSGAAGSWAELLRQLPPLGFAREHHALLQELAAAHAECQRLEQALRTMLFGVQTEALNLLERRVRERQVEHRLTGFRDLYDLWIECGEQVYARLAHSEAYCQLQGQLGNATVHLRARQQKVMEQALKQLDLPTRSEINSVHRQLREQARQLHELQQQVGLLQGQITQGQITKHDTQEPRGTGPRA